MINRKAQARKPALSGDRSRRTWLLCLSITAAFSILPLIMLALSLASCHPRVHMYHGSAAESSLCRVVRAFGIMTGEREDSSQPVASLAPKTMPSPTHQSMSPVLPSTSTSVSSPSPPPPQVPPSPSPPGPPNPSPPAVVSSASASNNMNIDKAGPLPVTTTGADLNKLNAAGVVNSPAGGLLQGGNKKKKTSKQEIDHVEHPQSDEDIERVVSFPHVSECNLCKVCIPHQEVANHPRAKAVEARMAYMLAHGDLLEEALAAPLTPGSDVDLDTQDIGRRRRQMMSNPHLWEDEDDESSLLQSNGSYITDSMDGGVIQVVDDERHRYILDPNAAAAVRGSGKQGTVRGSSRALAEMDEVLTDGLFRFM
ncbi:hypothetical protein CEUSTIGMA_g6414.t1 [Chlamydomonas eustigma]|uniref:Uncharacterized protein n=1 Tax=Chlamydomonas eustigma TaxID=1157962 RepID=A0A250X7B3_9CHLO|nr:hypothetical protein CEUSTIGMA_g6414.t1 [Chlamydomonas eustigma]|eukprot:GAX78974.1 hypothetical protein CEUSTIGMA_g6414.t1 [Chlamydomonas eustigma]